MVNNMINIVEAGKNIEKERKIEMIADIEVYTVMNALIIGAQSIFSYIHYIVGLFVALTGKKWEKYVVYGWEMRRQDVIEYLRKKTQTEIEDMLLETMRKKLKISKKKKKNGDVFSVCLIKYARKRFKKHAMEGLSVPEQVEYIFEKYPHMKKKDERKILSGWFLIALLLLVGVLVSRMTMKENLIISIVVFVIMEVFFASCAISKVKQEEALYYIWLARSEYGKKLVEASLMLEKIQGEERVELRENLQLLHFYRTILKKEEENLLQLNGKKEKTENKIEKNLKRIEELAGEEDLDKYSMRRNLREENQQLERVLADLEEQTVVTERNIEEFEARITEENEINGVFYQGLWSCYSKIEIRRDTLNHMLGNLNFEDLEKVEKRLYELNYAKDFKAQAEYKNKKAFISFRTQQGDIARIFVEYDKFVQKIVVSSFERDEKLKENTLTADDVKRIMDRREANNPGEKNNQELFQYLKRIEELSAETSELKQEKYKADIELKNKLKEITELNISIEDSAKRCMELEEKLKQVSFDKAQVDKIVAEYEKNQREFSGKLKEAEERKKELYLWKKKYDELCQEIQLKETNYKEMMEGLDKQNELLNENIIALESTLSFQQRITQEAKAKQQADQQAISKLESANEELKRSLKKSRNELSSLEKKKAEYLSRRRKDEEQLNKYKKELEKANEKANQSVAALKEAQSGVSSEKYRSTYKKIKETFPGLSEKAVTFFSTAEQFYGVFEENNSVDYSPIIVEYCKVLEVALWEYLRNSQEYQLELDKYYDKKRGETLGSAVFIVSKNEEKMLGKYYGDLEDIKSMRNEGAHNGVQGRMQTEKIHKCLWNSGLLAAITKAG